MDGRTKKKKKTEKKTGDIVIERFSSRNYYVGYSPRYKSAAIKSLKSLTTPSPVTQS